MKKTEKVIFSGENMRELSSCAFPGICQLENGRIFASFKGAETKGPYNKSDKAVVCISDDGGRTFGEMVDTGLVGQPGNVISGDKGQLLTVYINRNDIPEIRLAQSTDEGKAWRDILTVYKYERNVKGKQNECMNDVWSEMAAFSVGHPYIKRMKDGSVWVYYYSGPSTHRTDFCCTVLNLDK